MKNIVYVVLNKKNKKQKEYMVHKIRLLTDKIFEVKGWRDSKKNAYFPNLFLLL